jgi:hypothetical protein
MGLDTSHDCWHGPYSAFNRWRDKLAEAAGYTFHASDSGGGILVDIDWGNIEATIGHDLNGEWQAIPVRPDGTSDPLMILLAHSDCDGGLQVRFLAATADRLEDLLPAIDGIDEREGYYREKTERFIAGLRKAAAAGEPVIFS